jgi:CheY-like chemotaxis protein
VTDSPGRRRVLVVDDLADIRILIRRALSARGYEVDVASTLAAAREMDPGGYDAVLVDAHLGSERGIDLVKALLAEDPAAAQRCLVISGGAAGPLPDGVASLTKPFKLGQLIDAVRALHRPDAVPAPDGQADIRPAPDAPAPESVSRGGNQPPADEPQAWQLLGLVRRLRAHERRELVDFLHDGPIQELTALTLELQMISRSEQAGLAAHCDAMLRRLNAATASLRWLIDGSWPFLTPETRLAAALQQRTAWLLASPVTVDTGPPSALPAAAEVPVIVDVVELMLLAMLPDGQPVRAHVAVRTPERPIRIELTLTPATADDGLTGDPAAAQASLDELACALGASAQATLCKSQWRVLIVLPGQADVTPGAMT